MEKGAMTRIYSDADLWDNTMQKRRILGLFFGVTAAWFLAVSGLVVYYILLPYQDPNGLWVKIVSCVLTAAYIIFAFPCAGICCKRCRAYCKMLGFVSVGLKEYSVLPFVGIDDWITRDGVDVNVACFRVRNIKREEEMLRHIYVDGEKEFPPFEEGDIVRLVSQGNLLLEYEIIGKEEKKSETEAGISESEN